MRRKVRRILVAILLVVVGGIILEINDQSNDPPADRATQLTVKSKQNKKQTINIQTKYVHGQKTLSIGQVHYHFFVPQKLVVSSKLTADFWKIFAQQLKIPSTAVTIDIYPTSVSRAGNLVGYNLVAVAIDRAGQRTSISLPLTRRQLLVNDAQDQVITLAQITNDATTLNALKLQIFNAVLQVVQPQPATLAQTRQNFMTQPLNPWLAINQQQLVFYVQTAQQQLSAVSVDFTELRYFLPTAWHVTSQISPGKHVALTFDDGPNPNTTPQVLQILAQAQIHATFFMVGRNVTTYPQLARRVARAGHEIGNHTYDHLQLPNLIAAQVDQELTMTDVAIYQATGTWPRLMRPPYGSIDQTSVAIAGRPIIQWTVDSEDWKSQNAAMILRMIQQTTTPGAIILLHDIQPATVAALPNIISYLQAQGYQFVTIDDLIAQPLFSQWQYFGLGDQRSY